MRSKILTCASRTAKPIGPVPFWSRIWSLIIYSTMIYFQSSTEWKKKISWNQIGAKLDCTFRKILTPLHSAASSFRLVLSGSDRRWTTKSSFSSLRPSCLQWCCFYSGSDTLSIFLLISAVQWFQECTNWDTLMEMAICIDWLVIID